jgi:D-galactosamine 6-phosphate deaminase/isomerase
MAESDIQTSGHFTHAEIWQQPEIWPGTVRRVLDRHAIPAVEPVILTGAGTSAYAALAVEAAWPGSRAVSSTELFLEFRQYLGEDGLVVSFARSGDSPESTAVVEKIHRALPRVRHLAITCNPQGKLAQTEAVEAVVLDPRTNDRSLAMTSSFSNLALAGITLARPAELKDTVPVMQSAIADALPDLEERARKLAENPPRRAVVLSSGPLFGAAREARLKILEMTAGRVAPMAETFVGLRHGPMSFLEPDTLVLCLLSSSAKRRRYELDLVAELRAKRLGRLVALGRVDAADGPFEEVIATPASALADEVRTPAEIVFAQLLAYHLSLRLGLNPDNPSPGGVINRVVAGVRIYED